MAIQRMLITYGGLYWARQQRAQRLQRFGRMPFPTVRVEYDKRLQLFQQSCDRSYDQSREWLSFRNEPLTLTSKVCSLKEHSEISIYSVSSLFTISFFSNRLHHIHGMHSSCFTSLIELRIIPSFQGTSILIAFHDVLLTYS